MAADLILFNAQVYTVDPQMAWAEAVAVKNGRFLAVGTNEQIETFAGSHTERIDGRGRLVLPGLIDAHVHFLQYAVRQQQVNLFEGLVPHEPELRRLGRPALGDRGQRVSQQPSRRRVSGAAAGTRVRADRRGPAPDKGTGISGNHWGVNDGFKKSERTRARV